MKLNELKNTIKESLREVIREELREILLEAIKGGQVQTQQPVQQAPSENSSRVVKEDMRKKYADFIGGGPMNTNSLGMQNTPMPSSFNPKEMTDPVNGSLPSGEVSLEMINSFLKK